MSDRMTPIPFEHLLQWIFSEFHHSRSIFGIPSTNFFHSHGRNSVKVFGETIETPLGPAAGPHTQLVQNIVVAYLVGGRFFELKTVQQLDRLSIDKPCIDAQDEGYNVEWSQELTLEQSYDEYLKAWFAIHLLKETLDLSQSPGRGFVFNMSVGYTLEGIKSKGVDSFLNSLLDASRHPSFANYKSVAIKSLEMEMAHKLIKADETKHRILQRLESINPGVSNSVTLSTMHGCPPQEIEAIARYLIKEKGLHTYIKLNPTLLGFDTVRELLNSLGYSYISMERESFSHDLQFSDAVPMVGRLKDFAQEHGKEFGVKLSNTLGVNNTVRTLAGDQMYMSGRALFPLTIQLAHRLASAFNGDLAISYSGGASLHNIEKIISTGISPVTMVTDLLKPGGYSRLTQMAMKTDTLVPMRSAGRIELQRLAALADESLKDEEYRKSKRAISSVKISKELGKFDCYIAPCAVACPIHQDVAEYIRLVDEKRYADAFEVIVSKNPLPFITGHICDHECMNKCTRWDYDDPVQIRGLKRIAAEQGFDEYLERFNQRRAAVKNGIAVAVVGAGPSGLTAGYFLARAGFDVTIFEQAAKAGGTVQHVIPEFRLPQSAIDHDVEFVKKHGVKFSFGSPKDLSVSKLKNDGFKYIYLAIGAPKSNRLELSGNGKNVVDAVDFLKMFNSKSTVVTGKRVAVVGGGNSAMDAARASLRTKGVESVFLVYRRTKEFMPADKEEFDAAIAEGTVFKELLQPAEFTGKTLKCQKMTLGDVGSDGRRQVRAIENAYETLAVDLVISAVGEHVDTEILQKNNVSLDEKRMAITSDKTLETTVENVYIGGDARRGPSTVVESIADGRKVADAIIMKEKITPPSTIDLTSLFDVAKLSGDLGESRGNVLPTQWSTEVNVLSGNESSRCLACNLVCNKCVDVCPNRANIVITSSSLQGSFANVGQILHVDGLCNECGNCETFCPYGTGSPYKSKPTLFWSEKDFDESSNDGFFIKRQSETERTLEARIRFKGEVGSAKLEQGGDILHSSLTQTTNSPEFRQFSSLIAGVTTEYSYLLNTPAH